MPQCAFSSTFYSNIAFVNLPPTDQTNYVSFHLLTVNIATFLGMMVGTALVALIGEHVLTLLGMRFTSVQILLIIQALGCAIVPAFIFCHFQTLDPFAREARASK